MGIFNRRKKEEKPQIKVFITKTQKFRARIKENKNKASYEVTIGGMQWDLGKGKQYEAIIGRKLSIAYGSDEGRIIEM